ncbi:MAG TPA: succinate dehydrogenase, hydrophobic membrane anchor protein [Burkholderiaceae bacterium]|nr:succinate dehydrogenase, hydrophobic membrane anchor protein [Burkholderiaceae bacterium]
MAIGSKRLVVGAHYGLRSWLAQRVTAAVMIVYAIVLLGLWVAARVHDYDAWAGIFAPLPMKIATLLAFAALGYHAWVGVRDIWMDYVKPVGVRLALHLATILALGAFAAWAVQILWRV